MNGDSMTEDLDFDEFLNDPEIAQAFEDAELRDNLLNELRSIRKSARITQKQVAERMGTTQSAISDLEQGGDPYFSTLQRYARALGTTLRIAVDHPNSNLTVLTARSSYTNVSPPRPTFTSPKVGPNTPHSVNSRAYAVHAS